MRIQFMFISIFIGTIAVYANEDVDRIISALDDISNATQKLGTLMDSWSGKWWDTKASRLPVLSYKVLQQISEATNLVKKSRKLDDIESIDIQGPAKNLVANTNITTVYAIEAKAKIEERNPKYFKPLLMRTILNSLKQQKEVSARLSAEMLDLFSGNWGKGDANRTGAAIQELFDDAILAYEPREEDVVIQEE